jgi:hypothetical protein
VSIAGLFIAKLNPQKKHAWSVFEVLHIFRGSGFIDRVQLRKIAFATQVFSTCAVTENRFATQVILTDCRTGNPSSAQSVLHRVGYSQWIFAIEAT